MSVTLGADWYKRLPTRPPLMFATVPAVIADCAQAVVAILVELSAAAGTGALTVGVLTAVIASVPAVPLTTILFVGVAAVPPTPIVKVVADKRIPDVLKADHVVRVKTSFSTVPDGDIKQSPATVRAFRDPPPADALKLI